ncbi:HNH endonuclease signature motif containing protein [Stenotrophomonas geniculata]|uniref:HNH endonuclease signature motif containing protein n=1 Tax=Stenotrophomonas geniculata TaxID=86188 RepID=A0AAP5C8P1_9GAMM|nr:HNH endonuclease signature motif containing protein [Stenotrophomonas geniculata]MDP4309725.1 HNH endonuclease signature motif containing protein [Stenotrophomonas geniculata]MDQ7953107.1 HNH endonuclease signature motif containing protein [Stenotrophomonas geniculata]
MNEAKQSSLDDPIAIFSQAISELSARQSFNLPAKLRQQLRSMQTSCPICACDFSQQSSIVVAQIVPIEHGGPNDFSNCFLCCERCNRKRGTSDLLSLGEPFCSPTASPPVPSHGRALGFSPTDLVQRRLELLARSANHWTPHTRNSMKCTVLRHLAKRWAEPRFRAFAHHSSDLALIGFARRSGDAESLGVAKVLTKFQGASAALMDDDVSVYQVDPGRFLPLIWALIELNALVMPVRVPGKGAHAFGSEWQDFWPDHVRSVAALRSRLRSGHASNFGELARCPDASRVLSDRPDAVRKRRNSAARVERNRSQRLALYHQKRIEEASQDSAYAVLEARLLSLQPS